MCKYNNHYYWEYVLTNKKDLFKESLTNFHDEGNYVFISTTIIDYGRGIMDTNWSGYPNIKSLLGFIQYVYIPTAFYYIINKSTEEVFIPICSSDEFLEYVSESSEDYAESMEKFIKDINSYWSLEENQCAKKIKEFCKSFNSFWSREESILHLDIFLNPVEIAEYLISKEEFIDVFEEQIGLKEDEFLNTCKSFSTNKFIQRTFIEFLNNNIGCIV